MCKKYVQYYYVLPLCGMFWNASENSLKYLLKCFCVACFWNAFVCLVFEIPLKCLCVACFWNAFEIPRKKVWNAFEISLCGMFLKYLWNAFEMPLKIFWNGVKMPLCDMFLKCLWNVSLQPAAVAVARIWIHTQFLVDRASNSCPIGIYCCVCMHIATSNKCVAVNHLPRTFNCTWHTTINARG